VAFSDRFRAFVGGLLFIASVSIGAPRAAAAPGHISWVARFTEIGSGPDSAETVVVAPDGTAVYVTGTAGTFGGGEKGYNFASVALDASTGSVLWSDGYNGPGGIDYGCCSAISPDGSTLYVTGASQTPGRGLGWATLAYDAATGARQWVARFNHRTREQEQPRSIQVAPDGARIFVTGAVSGDFQTVAYDSEGRRLWSSRYDSWGCCTGSVALVVAPNGRRVFVTGTKYDDGEFEGDLATIAYRAKDGHQLWVDRYDGYGGKDDYTCCLAVSPDGSTVFVAGAASGRRTSSDGFATLAYDAARGAVRWKTRFATYGSPSAIAVSQSGELIHVTGQSNSDYGTVTYDAASGMKMWRASFDGTEGLSDAALSMALGPDGTVYVTGQSGLSDTTSPEYATVAYAPLTGDELWVSTYNDPAGGYHFATSIAVAPDGAHAYVTGHSAEEPDFRTEDFLTLALETS
jgi:hypothetical protein